MTQEEKQLLLKDLCGRLLYGIFVKDEFYDKNIYTIDYHPHIKTCKPYLRPMSSMTEEEKSTYLSYCECDDGDYTGETIYFDTIESFDYLNQIYIDYRNLIPKGLALEAPENMYVL